MTVSPRYDQYRDAWDTNVLIEVNSQSCTLIPLLVVDSQSIIDVISFLGS